MSAVLSSLTEPPNEGDSALTPPPYAWLAARARNALRRRAFMSIVAGSTFVAVLIGLVLIPRQASRFARMFSERVDRPDSTAIVATRTRALVKIANADSALADARRAMVRPLTPVLVDTFPPEVRAERDSLWVELSQLSRAMARAAESPLPPAFQALGETRALSGNAQVKVWLDSLETVDKLRAPFGAIGAGDPIYVALTARMNELGRSIRDAATLKRSELRSRIAPLQPTPASPTILESHIDTMPIIASRDSARGVLVAANRMLATTRGQNRAIDSAETRARELSNVGAPPTAMLMAALVVAVAMGFGLSFGAEVKRPRVAHIREAESISGQRVLAVIRPVEFLDRNRRESDPIAPPLIDIVSESYRTIYLHLAATGASIPIVTVTGGLAPVVATVAANLAAVSAYEARSTLLIDADPASSAVSAVLRLRSDPGLMGLLSGTARWGESIVSTTIGRDRPLDVIPSGTGRILAAAPDSIDDVRTEVTRMERRYDFIVIAAPVSYAQLSTNTIIPVQDVVLCARVGTTRLDELRSEVRSLRGVGRRLHGIVLWDDEPPRV